jgi:hypothetical protein
MVQRTIYVGASLQVITRLPTGAALQASVANTGEHAHWQQGTPITVQIPADALRVLALPAPAGEAETAEGASPGMLVAGG